MLRSQKGQALPLFALCFIVLIGFVGLVIDGGMAISRQQAEQSAADGAALAAGYVIVDQTFTAQPLPNYPAANSAAQNVVTTDGYASSALALAYLQADGTTPATSTLNVQYVQATVSGNSATYFMKALGFASISTSASATVLAAQGIQAPCGLCAVTGDGRGVHAVQSSITVNGGDFYVASVDPQHATQFEVSSSLTTSGGNNYYIPPGAFDCNGGSTCTPAFQPAPANYPAANPLANAPYPSVANVQTYGGGGTASPGIYNGLTVPANQSLNLTSGVYVLTGNLVLGKNAKLTSDAGGVMIFLACASYPAPCSTSSGNVTSPCTGTAEQIANTGPGGLGAYLDMSANGSTMAITPPTSGQYKGLAVFADRNNYSCNFLDHGTLSTGPGTWYTLNMPFDGLASDTLAFGQVVVPDFGKIFKSTLAVTMVAGITYTPPGESRVTLVK